MKKENFYKESSRILSRDPMVKKARRTLSLIYTSLLLLGLSTKALWADSNVDSWRFLLLADWHSAEKYVQLKNNPEWLNPAIKNDLLNLQKIKKEYGGEFIFMPGDSNGGHWDRAKFIRQYNPGGSVESTILQAGSFCYGGMIDSFKKAGYEKLLFAVGDHEIGDNPWRENSEKSKHLNTFKKIMAREFNYDKDTGLFKFTQKIGEIPSRPLGTPYEDTAFAYQHKNALFVTLDAFYQKSPEIRIGEEGTVTGDINSGQLSWFESVLKQANQDRSIEHIFVQSHLPILSPVKKLNSSGMLMDKGEDSAVWKLMRKYKVDVYFAGEVHANTVIQDSQSNLLQVVTRGNFFSNFQTVDICADKIEITCLGVLDYNLKDPNQDYEVIGSLVVDKRNPEIIIKGEGELELVDVNQPILHYDFESIIPLEKRPIIGLRDHKNFLLLRGKKATQNLPNRGEFGPQFDSFGTGISSTAGISGNAIQMTPESRLGVFAMGPYDNKRALSFSIWVKTKSNGHHILINGSPIWGSELKNFLNLNINNGFPEVSIAKDSALLGEIKVNDNQWHNITVVVPKPKCYLSKLLIYLDGELLASKIIGTDRKVDPTNNMKISIGGYGTSHKVFDQLANPYKGSIDELKIWTRPISQQMIQRDLKPFISLKTEIITQ